MRDFCRDVCYDRITTEPGRWEIPSVDLPWMPRASSGPGRLAVALSCAALSRPPTREHGNPGGSWFRVTESAGLLATFLDRREEGSPSMPIEGYPKEATLKDERVVTIRPLTNGDFDKLRAFFEALPEEDRLFMRHDVTDSEVVGQWVGQIDFDRVIPLVAEEGDKIVANSTLHLSAHGWATHVGHIRLATARTHRHVGLGTLIAREMVLLAEKRNLEKLQSQVIEDNVGSVKLFENLGFKVVAVLKDLVKDQKGNKRNLAIMIADVADIERILEDWIHDSMIPAFRVPDDGVE